MLKFYSWEGKNMILPLEKPFTSTYPYNANAISILTCHEKTFPWLYNNFIQLIGVKNKSDINCLLDFFDFSFEKCPFLEFQKISKQLIMEKWDNLLSFVCESIKLHYYIYLVAKKKEISAYHTSDDIVHDLFIYGYDDKKQELSIADNFRGKYEFKKCSYQEFLKAIFNISEEQEKYNEFNGCIILLKYKENEKSGFYPSRVKESIADYLNGTPTKNWYTRFFDPWMEHNRELIFQYGIKNYDFIDRIIDTIMEKKYFPYATLQPLHLLTQHKRIMSDRVLFMYKNGYIYNLELVESFQKIANLADILLSLIMKTTIGSQNIENKIKKIYVEIKEKEQCALENLYHSL